MNDLAGSPSVLPTGQREWIAVVDDDPSIRSSLARLLGAEGFDVETFACSRALLAGIVPVAPACLVLDVHLGTESGFALQETLAVTHPGVPVIFITGHDKISSAELARRAGPDGFLRKPFDGDAIVGMIRRRTEILERRA